MVFIFLAYFTLYNGLQYHPVVLCISWPKYWSFSFSISHPNEYSGLISFKVDWFTLLAVLGTLKSLLQHYSSKKHQFFGALPSLWPSSHICTWLLEQPSNEVK